MNQSFAGRFDCAATCTYPSVGFETLSPLNLCTGLVTESQCEYRGPCPESCLSLPDNPGAFHSAAC